MYHMALADESIHASVFSTILAATICSSNLLTDKGVQQLLWTGTGKKTIQMNNKIYLTIQY